MSAEVISFNRIETFYLNSKTNIFEVEGYLKSIGSNTNDNNSKELLDINVKKIKIVMENLDYLFDYCKEINKNTDKIGIQQSNIKYSSLFDEIKQKALDKYSKEYEKLGTLNLRYEKENCLLKENLKKMYMKLCSLKEDITIYQEKLSHYGNKKRINTIEEERLFTHDEKQTETSNGKNYKPIKERAFSPYKSTRESPNSKINSLHTAINSQNPSNPVYSKLNAKNSKFETSKKLNLMKGNNGKSLNTSKAGFKKPNSTYADTPLMKIDKLNYQIKDLKEKATMNYSINNSTGLTIKSKNRSQGEVSVKSNNYSLNTSSAFGNDKDRMNNKLSTISQAKQAIKNKLLSTKQVQKSPNFIIPTISGLSNRRRSTDGVGFDSMRDNDDKLNNSNIDCFKPQDSAVTSFMIEREKKKSSIKSIGRCSIPEEDIPLDKTFDQKKARLSNSSNYRVAIAETISSQNKISTSKKIPSILGTKGRGSKIGSNSIENEFKVIIPGTEDSTDITKASALALLRTINENKSTSNRSIMFRSLEKPEVENSINLKKKPLTKDLLIERNFTENNELNSSYDIRFTTEYN